MDDKPVLSVRGLRTNFFLQNHIVRAVDDVNLDFFRGRITAILGGSGSGKSVTSLSILNLVEPPGRIVGGQVLMDGQDLLSLSESELMKIRGKRISMIFQEPSASLDPVMKIKDHLAEVVRIHDIPLTKRKRAEVFCQILERVGLREPEKILGKYPFELSGGMCQRIMVAMGLLSRAEVLIADEPTSALDLTTQIAVLSELKKCKNASVAVVLITHDLGVVAQMADDVYVMYNGKIVEYGNVFNIFYRPQNAYTKSLMNSIF